MGMGFHRAHNRQGAEMVEWERGVSRKNIFLAALLTLLFFSMGLLLGVLLTEKRVEHLEGVAAMQKMDYESMQLQTLFLEESADENKCLVVSKAMDAHIHTLSETGARIEQFISDAKISGESFDEVKREYTLAQLKYWLLAKKAKKMCSRNMVSVIYFYSDTGDCSSCSTQSRILTHLKEMFPEQLLVFSFDASFEQEAMIQMLKMVYGIDKYPTLIIDEAKHSGLVTEEDLLAEICSGLGNEHPACLAL